MGIKRCELYLHLSEHSKGGGPAEVYLFVDDVHAWVKMCEDAGIALHQPLEKKPWGNTEMMLVDPYGNGMRVAQLHTHDPA